MSLAYGFTPEAISGMTIYQMLIYCGVPVAEDGKVRMTREEYTRWFGSRQARRRMSGTAD